MSEHEIWDYIDAQSDPYMTYSEDDFDDVLIESDETEFEPYRFMQ